MNISLMRRWRMPTLAVALLGLIPAAPLSAAPLSAADILEIYRSAQAEDAVLAAAEAQYEATTEAKPQARAALLPQVQADGSFGWTKSYSENYFVPDEDSAFGSEPVRNTNVGSARN